MKTKEVKTRNAHRLSLKDFAASKTEFILPKGQERLRELIVYIADQCRTDPTFGLTKLYKILYFSDAVMFATTGKPITGVPYIRMPAGPVPEPAFQLLHKMDGHDIKIRTPTIGDYTQRRIVALREPNLDLFKSRHIATVAELIRMLWGKTAKQVSEASHTRGWKIARQKSHIPYQAFLISDEGITDYDIQRARELSKQYGWSV